ncbi:putative S-locus-specific glycoprotein/EP1 [Helianthus annuus]|uniref:S-locus-specific glycoprotein/EP1 n=1 Tax=Helianthus annuus TaxID=4232 RepID=A0A9K3HLT9_HELAN|nr:epidermis-specific secreted glycoprotein EP1 isoform X1 [Helianthus annuus]KAF5780828.1 putative S-locus-specific glycoprotein/EP1 [Helianthus annuus]KAJ0516413.1 putative S-locus-specific glycoprotein/EP1 [Helianthus annuus]
MASNFFLLLLSFQLFSSLSEAVVPASETFTYVNQGDFGEYIVEYDANYRALSQFTNPFQLCFYNTTSNAFTIALRMGTVRSESVMRWVWEANRGNPVRENATLTFGTDGNLVLADADGRVVWQTNTANKGVVGFQLLPTGNMVLHDGKGNYLWQSFDSPTDTLLVGQTLRPGGPNKLVSRLSEVSNVDGPYSLVLEPKGLAFYYKSPNSPRPMLYRSWFITGQSSLTNLTFNSVEYTEFLYYLTLEFFTTDPTSWLSRNKMAHSGYNNTLSYLRLGIDGNVRFYTYNPNVQEGVAWELVFTFLDRNFVAGECQLPGRCGNFGLCEDSQCVACPTPNGLIGWSKECEVKKVTSCKASDFGYYKLQGVDHFTIKYTRGDETKQSDCESKCTKDCKCMGYFYHTDSSRCWIAYDLKTLTRVGNSTHLAYIKTPNK